MGSYFFPSAGSSSANLNLNNSEEKIGFATDGTTTTVTASGTANTKGSYVTIGTSSNDWAGFWLYVGPSSASSGRFIIDIRRGGSTVIVPDLYVEPSQSVQPVPVWIPLAVTAGLIEARCQAGSGSQTVKVAIVGVVRNSQSAPMYTAMTAINVDTTNTRASGTDIAVQGSAGTTYGDLSASLAAQYKAFLFSPGGNGTTPATSQQIALNFATGAAASEVEFSWHASWISNVAAPFGARAFKFIEKTINSAVRLSVKPVALTPGTDAIRVAAYGFA